MSSLKCSKCGAGIHYHDEPDGTQYIAFPMESWERLLLSKLRISRYTLDSPEPFFIIWKCKECGALHAFLKDEIHVTAAYEKIDGFYASEEAAPCRYIAFSDVDWAEITEPGISGEQLNNSFPDIKPLFAEITETTITLYDVHGNIDSRLQYKRLIDKTNNVS